MHLTGSWLCMWRLIRCVYMCLRQAQRWTNINGHGRIQCVCVCECVRVWVSVMNCIHMARLPAASLSIRPFHLHERTSMWQESLQWQRPIFISICSTPFHFKVSLWGVCWVWRQPLAARQRNVWIKCFVICCEGAECGRMVQCVVHDEVQCEP